MQNIISVFLQFSSYLFIFYILTNIKRGGDTKYIVPYVTFILSMLYMFLKSDFTIFKNRVFYSLLAYVIISYLLIPFSFDPSITFDSLNEKVLPGLFLFIAVYLMIKNMRRLSDLMGFLFFLLVFILLSGYFSFAQGIFSDYATAHVNPDIHLLHYRKNLNEFAMVVNLLLPSGIVLLINDSRKYVKYMSGAVVILAVAAIFLSLSRFGWLILILMACMWSVFLVRNIRVSPWGMGALWTGILVSFLLFWLVVPSFKNAVNLVAEQVGTFNNRTEIWERNIKAIKESPLTGWGYGDKIMWDGHPFILDKKNELAIIQKIGAHSHNEMLNVLFHQGFAGLIFYMYLIGYCLVSIYKSIKNSHEGRKNTLLFAIFTVFMGVIIFHSFFEIIPFTYICLILGLFSGINALHKDEFNGNIARYPLIGPDS